MGRSLLLGQALLQWPPSRRGAQRLRSVAWSAGGRRRRAAQRHRRSPPLRHLRPLSPHPFPRLLRPLRGRSALRLYHRRHWLGCHYHRCLRPLPGSQRPPRASLRSPCPPRPPQPPGTLVLLLPAPGCPATRTLRGWGRPAAPGGVSDRARTRLRRRPHPWPGRQGPRPGSRLLAGTPSLGRRPTGLLRRLSPEGRGVCGGPGPPRSHLLRSLLLPPPPCRRGPGAATRPRPQGHGPCPLPGLPLLPRTRRARPMRLALRAAFLNVGGHGGPSAPRPVPPMRRHLPGLSPGRRPQKPQLSGNPQPSEEDVPERRGTSFAVRPLPPRSPP